MAVIQASTNDKQILASLLRAEAESEGEMGMPLVGNVGVNRIRANCLDFKKIRTIPQMVHQSPGGFEAIQKGYFHQRARDSEIRLARKVMNGRRFHPPLHSVLSPNSLRVNPLASYYSSEESFLEESSRRIYNYVE